MADLVKDTEQLKLAQSNMNLSSANLLDIHKL